MKTDKLLHLIQQKKFMRSGGALPLPKHQWITSQVLSQPGPTKAKANFANSSSLGMATQNAGNILNQIMSNPKNQPFVNFIDTRINDPVVPGKKLEATRKHHVKGVSREELDKMVNQARKLNTDPSTAITTALWETNMGQTDQNLVHDLYQVSPTEEGLEGFDAQADMAMQAINRQLAIGKRKYPQGPFYKQMQAMQGYGNLYPNTENIYYGHDNQAFFGIPVTQNNPLRTNIVFPYGKTIENFRDSVVIPTLDQYGIQYKEQGGLTKAQSGQTVSELWKQVTGSDWSKAKELGVTDGSYEKNMELRNALAKYAKTQPQPKTTAPKYPWSPGGKYAHTDNKRLVVDKQRKPDVVPPSRINALVADAMNQNNPTPVDAIPNMNMKAAQDIANLNSKVVNRDDTKVAPKGSTRSKLQNALNYANEAVENTYGNPFVNPAGKWVYDMFVGMPSQSGLNIANTAMGDRPIRNDDDIVNLGLDAATVIPYAGEAFSIGKNAFNKGRRALAFNAIDPVGYGAMQKLKKAPKTFMNNVFIDPQGRAARVGQALDASASPISQTNLGKRRLDAWNIYLQRPQQYNTFTKIGDNTYRINNPVGYDKSERFESVMDDVDNLIENNGVGNKFATERSQHPGFSFSQYRDDIEGGIMGGHRVDMVPTRGGNLKFRVADTWDIRPWEKRGNIFADPAIKNNPAYQQGLMKHYNKFLKDIEVGPLIGGKPFNIENNILYSPNKAKIIRRWEEGGELTSEKAIEILQDGTVYGKPLTAAQKRYFTIIANKNKRNG